jgi:hypothetical protein
MVFGLLAMDVPAERRSTTLNLVYLPLYAAGIVGPALGAGVVVATGLAGPFLAAAAIFIIGAIVIATRPARDPALVPIVADPATRNRRGLG